MAIKDGEKRTTRKPLGANGGSKAHTQPRHPIDLTLESFIGTIDDFRDAFALGLPALVDKRQKQLDDLRSRLSAIPLKEFREDEGVGITLEVQHASAVGEFLDVLDEVKRHKSSRIFELTARSLFVGIFTEFDVFMGSLLKCLYTGKPEILKGISREITLAELTNFETLEAVKLDLLDKEIDAFRRESYVEQFEAVERKFKVSTLRKFHEWPEFVEISQRRNLMTHTGGLISEQYISVCEREGYKFASSPSLNARLEIDPTYIWRSFFVMQKVAFMLAHTLWRKVFPADAKRAQEAANDAVYALLQRRHWNLASEIGAFLLTDSMRQDLDEMTLKVRLINTAIGCKFANQEERCFKLLDDADWSASVREFKLAVSVLRDDFDAAAGLMRDIGKKGELIEQIAYHTWPLFRSFRNDQRFHSAYKAVYGVDFATTFQKSEVGTALAELVVDGKRVEVGKSRGEKAAKAVRKRVRAPNGKKRPRNPSTSPPD